MDIIEIASYAAAIGSILTLAAIIIKPIRERLFGLKAISEGQKCLLRDSMLRTYHEHAADRTLTEDDYNNFEMCFKAYTALGGNSFVIKIHNDIQDWKIV